MQLETFLPWTGIIPELALAIMAMALLLIGVFQGDKSARSINVCASIALIIVALSVCAIQVSVGPDAAVTLPGNLHVAGMLSSFMKLLILMAAVLSLMLSSGYLQRSGIARPEYPVLIMLSVVGMMLMVSASNFLVLYMGLELQSLALYVLAAFHRDSTRSTEAGLKYFVLGALSSGLLLYGISLVYGFTGTIGFSGVAEVLAANPHHAGATLGLVFILAALSFKVSAAPFHMWTPDVYEGAPTSVTAFFSVVPKLAGMGLLLQVLFGPFASLAPDWSQLVAIMAALSMAVGALGALGQTSIKRLLAYSSIGHVGFALMALAAHDDAGIKAVLLYLAFYVIMSLGAFSVVLLMRRDNRMLEEIGDLSGISRLHPGLAAAMAILMFSMAGIPPMVGFFTKLYVFMAALQAGLIGLSIIGAVSSVVGAYYYIRIIKVMYFDEPVAGFDTPLEGPVASTLVATSILTLAGVALLAPLAALAQLAADGLIRP